MQLSELPALRVAFLVGAGIVTTHLWEPDLAGLLFTGLLTLFLLTLHLVGAVNIGSKRGYSARLALNSTVEWAWLVTLYLTGMSVMGLFQLDQREEHRRHEWVNRVFAEDLDVIGILVSVKEPTEGSTGRYTLEIRMDSLGFLSSETGLSVQSWIRFRTGGRFRLSESEDTLGPSPSLQSGQKLLARVRLYPAQENHNPGGFNYAGWLQKRGYFLQGVILTYEILPHKTLTDRIWSDETTRADSLVDSPISSLRTTILRRIEDSFSPETAPFLKAFILGDKTAMDPESKEAFSRAGLSHIMAVSGLHVGFLLTPIWMLLPVFRQWRTGPLAGMLLLTGFLAIYAALTGFSTSVNRASLMAVLLGFGSLYGKSKNSLNQMAVAATMILLISPAELLEPGFQLSFGAVTLLLLWMPAVQQFVDRTIRNRILSGVLQVMSVTIVVQTGLTPILAYWFGEISLIAPFSNLLVVPLLSFLMPFTILLLIVAPLAETVLLTDVLSWVDIAPWTNIAPRAEVSPQTNIVAWVFQLHHLLVEWILFVSEQAGQESLSTPLTTPSLTMILVWIGLLCAILPSVSAGFRWKTVRMILIILLIEGMLHLAEGRRPNPLRLVVLDSGHGDALFFQTPSGKHYLIDTGTWSPGWSSGKGVLLPFLKAEGVERIHGLFLTHPHADHIGGAAEILSTFQVDTLYRPAANYDSELNRTIDSLLLEKGIPERNPMAGQSFLLGGEIQVFVLNPTGNPDSNVNNVSLVMKWMYGEVSFMLTGDAEASVEQEILQRFQGEYYDWLRSDVLKAGHHGSKSSSTTPFIDAVSPRFVIVTLAFRNRYRHPHKEVSNRLMNATGSAGNVYFTSLDGPVFLFSDSKKIRKIVSLKER